MPKYINADKAIATAQKRLAALDAGSSSYMSYSACMDVLRKATAEDVREDTHGQWIEDDYGYNRCSECNYEFNHPGEKTPYCPQCGASMEPDPETTEEKQSEFGKPEKQYAQSEKKTRAEILDAAKRIVTVDREEQYGKPEDCFEAIAALWANYLQHRRAPTDVLNDYDVAAMMALLKIARIATGGSKADNWIDLAGYAACGGELQRMRGREMIRHGKIDD